MKLKIMNLCAAGALLCLQTITAQTFNQFTGAASGISNEHLFLAGDDDGHNLRHAEFGIRYMPVFTALDFRTSNGEIVHGSVKLGHGVAAMMAVNISKHLGLQMELNYYKTSQSFNDQYYTREITLSYINVPLLLSLNTSKRAPVNLNLVTGPQFGFNVGSDMKSSGTGSNDSIKAVLAVKQRDIGLAYGAGLEFALNNNHTVRLDIGYRGFFGLVNISNSTATNSYNVVAKTTRKTNAAYVGFTVMF